MDNKLFRGKSSWDNETWIVGTLTILSPTKMVIRNDEWFTTVIP